MSEIEGIADMEFGELLEHIQHEISVKVNIAVI